MTKGRIKQLAVKWGLMMSPVWIALIWGAVWHPQKAQAYQTPPTYRILWYPNGSPAWAGGTVWPEGLMEGHEDGDYWPTEPWTGGPVYAPGMPPGPFMPQIIATNTASQMVIDISTNYCSTGDIPLGFAYTQQLYYLLGVPHWGDIVGSTNWVIMPDGSAEAQWNMTTATLTNYFGQVAQIPVLNFSPIIRTLCPSGGTGGQ